MLREIWQLIPRPMAAAKPRLYSKPPLPPSGPSVQTAVRALCLGGGLRAVSWGTSPCTRHCHGPCGPPQTWPAGHSPKALRTLTESQPQRALHSRPCSPRPSGGTSSPCEELCIPPSSVLGLLPSSPPSTPTFSHLFQEPPSFLSPTIRTARGACQFSLLLPQALSIMLSPNPKLPEAMAMPPGAAPRARAAGVTLRHTRGPAAGL